jgi:alpha/beta hydrolase fold
MRTKGRNIVISIIFSLMFITWSFAIMTTHVAYGQASQGISDKNNANSLNIQNIPVKKVHVGDIDVAYKMFGRSDPLILFNGASDSMDAWDPSFLTGISSNHTVIVFDQRGIGNSTVGSKPYTYPQLANDTAGLLDALKIPKADVMGYSLGGHIAQAFTISHPDIVYLSIYVSTTSR